MNGWRNRGLLGWLCPWFLEIKKHYQLDFHAWLQIFWISFNDTESSHCEWSNSEACDLFSDGRYQNPYQLICFDTCFSMKQKRKPHKVYFRNGFWVQDGPRGKLVLDSCPAGWTLKQDRIWKQLQKGFWRKRKLYNRNCWKSSGFSGK